MKKIQSSCRNPDENLSPLQWLIKLTEKRKNKKKPPKIKDILDGKIVY